MPSYVTLGKDETGREIKLGDVERRGGTYIEGKPRTGKSKLLISMALQDSNNDHALLFIDPHADAIQGILERIPERRQDDVIVLDPTHKTHAFGINPLYCTHPHDLRERQLGFGQARDVFAKVFGAADERLGILLSKYLGNCLYPLIENQGYSLYDIWYFIQNKPFREYILKKVKFSHEVVEFWHDVFDKMPQRDQREETESLLNRIDVLRRNPYIKHVISQPIPTIDFVEVMQQKKIVLLRIPAWQDDESRSFIGTLVISQLLKVIFLRTEISEHLRTPFAIYCDEFEYVTTPDFAKLFTQTGKFNIMPTVAHQERVSQLKPDDPNRGATLAAPNKVLFSLIVHDSNELAPEFAKDSPTETKRERQLIISQNPVEDILKGHANPTIQAFVTEYLRSLSHRLEDTKAMMERERIQRQQSLDAAAWMRLQAQIFKEDLSKPASWSRGAIVAALSAASHSLQGARAHNNTLLQLFESNQALRQFIRSLDRFLTETMEGRVTKGQEAYARFLLELVSVFFPLSIPLALYIALEYGNARTSSIIPFEFARANRLFPTETAVIAQRLHQELADQTAREDAAFYNRQQEEFSRDVASYRAVKEKIKQGRVACVREQLSFGTFDWNRFPRPLDVNELVRAYIPLVEYPSVQQALAPYYSARFAPAWQGQFPTGHKLMPWMRDQLKVIREENAREREYVREYLEFWEKRVRREPGPGVRHQIDKEEKEGARKAFAIKFHECVLDRFEPFVERHGEGALVALVLLTTAASPDRFQQSRYVSSSSWCYVPRDEIAKLAVRPDTWSREEVDYEHYYGYHMLSIPQLVNHQPCDVLWFLQSLHVLMAPLNIEVDCRKYYWCGSTQGETFSWSDLFRPLKRHLALAPYDPANHKGPYGGYNGGYKESVSILARNSYRPARIYQILAEREDVKTLKKALEGHARTSSLYGLAQRHCGGSSWQNWLVIHYLQARACDLARYGQTIADLTFPQPTLKGITAQEVADTVSWMASLLQAMAQHEEQQELAEVSTKLQDRQRFWSTVRPARALVPKMPDSLPSRLLNQTEIDAVKKVCLRELSACSVVTVIKDFVRFCDLLARPENHIRVPSTQYIETQVNTYTTAEMTNQTAKELINLPPRSAYAKVVSLAQGRQSVWKGKIQTLELEGARARAGDVETLALHHAIAHGILRKRSVIEEEISKRQERWRRGPGKLPPPPTHTGGDKPPTLPPGRNGQDRVPPPPTTYLPKKIPEEG